MTNRYLRAEELARYAGVAKSTVLAAIRRGEIASSRTVGRGTRISVETARAYLESRGCPIPHELREASAWSVAVLTDDASMVDVVRKACGASWTVAGGPESYATLLWIGAHTPRTVVVDLSMAMINPCEVIRALRAQKALAGCRVVALGGTAEMATAAKAMGADDVATGKDPLALARAIAGQRAELR
jgi:excisionase family DNA binding protein